MTDKIKEGWKKSAETQRMPTEKVLIQFREAHGDYYDYSKMVYLTNKTKIEIICPIQGSFRQAPNDHKRGARCLKCAIAGMIRGLMHE